MTEGERGLLDWLAINTGMEYRIHQLARILLQNNRSATIQSALNNDGSPLQVCFTYGSRSRKTRIIGDPAVYIENAELHFSCLRHALNELVAISNSNSLADLCDETLERLLPVQKSCRDLQAGLFWLASSLTEGFALYVNSRWGENDDRWADAQLWLQDILSTSSDADTVLKSLRPYCRLASVGIEGSTLDNARAKIYWRLAQPVSLNLLGIPLLEDAVFSYFLQSLEADTIALSGLVFSVGFGLVDGRLLDTKIDVCAHCIRKKPSDWVSVISDICSTRELVPFDIVDGIMQGRCEVAFIGFGLDTEQKERLNVYLKAPTRRFYN